MKNKEKIQAVALRTIEIEMATIRDLKSSIDEDFNKCINAIFESKGRVIFTGIGKSAIIAQKIVSTLNSTGTPSVFMHAADAIHGDLGMITSEDIVCCVSKSGETSEIKVLVPLLRNLGNTLIGMVARKESYLGMNANFVLHTPVTQEADPNNLAPTASTTAQMVLGDAMASSLLALRGFTQQDFAQFHPGGTLGKQLYLRIRDIYPKNEKPLVYPDTNIRATIVEMTSKRLGVTVVVDTSNRVVGIITDGDLRRMLEREEETRGLLAKEIMTSNPKTIEANELAVKALEIMRINSITQLIVVDNDKYVGVIHLHDLISEGLI